MCNCSYGINDYMTIDDANAGTLPLVDQIYQVGAPGSYRRVDWPKVNTTPNAPEKVLCVELNFGYILDWYSPNTVPSLVSPTYPYINQIDWKRHAASTAKAGTSNVLYLDGHVSAAKQNPHGTGGHDPVGEVNDLCGTAYQVGPAVLGRMQFQSQPY